MVYPIHVYRLVKHPLVCSRNNISALNGNITPCSTWSKTSPKFHRFWKLATKNMMKICHCTFDMRAISHPEMYRTIYGTNSMVTGRYNNWLMTKTNVATSIGYSFMSMHADIFIGGKSNVSYIATMLFTGFYTLQT